MSPVESRAAVLPGDFRTKHGDIQTSGTRGDKGCEWERSLSHKQRVQAVSGRHRNQEKPGAKEVWSQERSQTRQRCLRAQSHASPLPEPSVSPASNGRARQAGW